MNSANIDNLSVSRTQDVIAIGRKTPGIAGEPDIAPEDISRPKKACRDDKYSGQGFNAFHALSFSSRTIATPDEKGKLTNSKLSDASLIKESHLFTPE